MEILLQYAYIKKKTKVSQEILVLNPLLNTNNSILYERVSDVPTYSFLRYYTLNKNLLSIGDCLNPSPSTPLYAVTDVDDTGVPEGEFLHC